MGMLMGNASVKTVSSVSNGFALRMPSPGSMLVVSCVKCRACRMVINGGASFGVMLRSRVGTLSRMIMMTCKSRGGRAMANTMDVVGDDRLITTPMTGMAGTLINGLPKMIARRPNKHPNRSTTAVLVHNGSAFGSTSPLVVVSNMRRRSFSRLSTGRVRDLSMLGSTSSATMCNVHNTGNIVLVAAGENGRKGPGVSIATG